MGTTGERLHCALVAWCGVGPSFTVEHPDRGRAPALPLDVDRLVTDLFRREGSSLVRLARLFVDDRNAAEDLVQEAFIRLARNAAPHRGPGHVRPPTSDRSSSISLATTIVAGWCRCAIVFPSATPNAESTTRSRCATTNARCSRRCASSRTASGPAWSCVTTTSSAPTRSPATLGISRNSVKTHLQRGLAALESHLAESAEAHLAEEVLG